MILNFVFGHKVKDCFILTTFHVVLELYYLGLKPVVKVQQLELVACLVLVLFLMLEFILKLKVIKLML
jgi:hypothetical protein